MAQKDAFPYLHGLGGHEAVETLLDATVALRVVRSLRIRAQRRVLLVGCRFLDHWIEQDHPTDGSRSCVVAAMRLRLRSRHAGGDPPARRVAHEDGIADPELLQDHRHVGRSVGPWISQR